jgi:predicted ATPase
MKRIIISGGPSSGKTTLINELKNLGFNCFDEVSREIIENQNINTSIKEFDFEETVFNKRIEQYHLAKSDLQFYDRSFIDGLAYMKMNQIIIPDSFVNKSKELRYHSTVFICPFWSQIFENDSQRLENIEQAKKIYNQLKSIYSEFDYKIAILPKGNLKNRIKFIFDHI